MIRKVKKSDFPKLKELIREFMIDYNRKEVLSGIQFDFMHYKEIEKIISRTAKKYCDLKSSQKAVYVYEEDGNLLGYIYAEVYKNSDRTLSTVGHVEDWFVSKQHRGKNIGKQLWDKMMDFFKQRKVQIVKLAVFSQNKDSYELYKKMGFEVLDMTLLKRLN